MGTDITFYLEAKFKDSNDWEFVAEFFVGRDYNLFGLLAGVRGYRKPEIEPRGLPVDFTKTWEFDSGVNHGASWLNKKEFKKVFKRMIGESGKPYGEPFLDTILNSMEFLEMDYNAETRVVFWFDS